MSVIVTGFVYTDKYSHHKLPTPVGPFDDRQAADEYMSAQGPLWGSWIVERLHMPLSKHERENIGAHE